MFEHVCWRWNENGWGETFAQVGADTVLSLAGQGLDLDDSDSHRATEERCRRGFSSDQNRTNMRNSEMPFLVFFIAFRNQEGLMRRSCLSMPLGCLASFCEERLPYKQKQWKQGANTTVALLNWSIDEKSLMNFLKRCDTLEAEKETSE
jgi:hypothetical protein